MNFLKFQENYFDLILVCCSENKDRMMSWQHSLNFRQIKFPDFSLIWSILLKFADFPWLEKVKLNFPGWLGTLKANSFDFLLAHWTFQEVPEEYLPFQLDSSRTMTAKVVQDALLRELLYLQAWVWMKRIWSPKSPKTWLDWYSMNIPCFWGKDSGCDLQGPCFLFRQPHKTGVSNSFMLIWTLF